MAVSVLSSSTSKLPSFTLPSTPMASTTTTIPTPTPFLPVTNISLCNSNSTSVDSVSPRGLSVKSFFPLSASLSALPPLSSLWSTAPSPASTTPAQFPFKKAPTTQLELPVEEDRSSAEQAHTPSTSCTSTPTTESIPMLQIDNSHLASFAAAAAAAISSSTSASMDVDGTDDGDLPPELVEIVLDAETESTPEGNAQTNPQLPSVFFDFDGTVVPTDSQHVCYYFIWALPNLWQRYFRLIIFTLAIGFIGLVDLLFGETPAIYMLVRVIFTGLSVHDTEIAVREGVTPKLKTLIRPAIRREIEKHRQAGRRIAILSGNLRPLIAETCAWLDCDCFATELEVDPATEKYTGKLVGKPCVREFKVDVIRQALQPGPTRGGQNDQEPDLDEEASIGGEHEGTIEQETTPGPRRHRGRSIILNLRRVHEEASTPSAHSKMLPPTATPVEEEMETVPEDEGVGFEGRLIRSQPVQPVFPGLYGYGNSMNDLFFLELVEYPFAVTPDRGLGKVALHRNWSKTFFNLTEPQRSCFQLAAQREHKPMKQIESV